MNITDNICGFCLVYNSMLTVEGTPYEIIRTWRERIFTLPWCPWQAIKVVIPQIPSREIIVLEQHKMLVIHPAMRKEVMEALRYINNG